MSRAYRIAVKGSVERIVHVDDGVCTSLELLPILPKERMSEHLADELVRRGFARDGNVASRSVEDGILVEVELDTGRVTVRIDSDVAIDVKGRREAAMREGTPEKIEEARQKIATELQASLESEAEMQAQRGRREATAKLEARLKDLRQELDGVVNRVTAQALKEKARQMGEVQEIVEDEKTGALTIKVKL